MPTHCCHPLRSPAAQEASAATRHRHLPLPKAQRPSHPTSLTCSPTRPRAQSRRAPPPGRVGAPCGCQRRWRERGVAAGTACTQRASARKPGARDRPLPWKIARVTHQKKKRSAGGGNKSWCEECASRPATGSDSPERRRRSASATASALAVPLPVRRRPLPAAVALLAVPQCHSATVIKIKLLLSLGGTSHESNSEPCSWRDKAPHSVRGKHSAFCPRQ